jgi:hypothetical protein
MPRPVFRPLTRRSAPPSPTQSDRFAGYKQVARLVGTGDGEARSAMQIANDLQQLLVGGAALAGDVIADTKQRRHTAGRSDAAAGEVDAKRYAESESYRAGAESFIAEALLLRDEASLRDFIRSSWNVADGDLTKLQQISAEHLKQSELGAYIAAHPEYKDELLEARTQTLYKVADEVAAEQIQAQAEADHAAAWEVFDRHVDDGTLTTEQLQSIDHRLAAQLGGPTARRMVLRMLTNAAMSRGQPELLDVLPDKWDNGVPTSKLVPEEALQIENARIAAQRAKESREAEEARQREDGRNEARRTARNEIATDIVAGQSGVGLNKARKLLEAGVLDFEDYRALQNFSEDLANDAGGGDDEGSQAALDMEVRLRTGEADLSELMQSSLSVKEKRRLLPLAGRKDDARSRNYRSDLRLRSTPPRALGGEIRAADIQRQADILAEYDELVDGGMQPKDAYAEMRRRNPDLFSHGPSNPRGGNPLPAPKTQAEYDALPSGTTYIDTDGVTKRKR